MSDKPHDAGLADSRRLAFLVRVDHFDHSALRDLEFSEKDMIELADVLKSRGFEVVLLTTPLQRTIRRRPQLQTIFASDWFSFWRMGGLRSSMQSLLVFAVTESKLSVQRRDRIRVPKTQIRQSKGQTKETRNLDCHSRDSEATGRKRHRSQAATDRRLPQRPERSLELRKGSNS